MTGMPVCECTYKDMAYGYCLYSNKFMALIIKMKFKKTKALNKANINSETLDSIL